MTQPLSSRISRSCGLGLSVTTGSTSISSRLYWTTLCANKTVRLKGDDERKVGRVLLFTLFALDTDGLEKYAPFGNHQMVLADQIQVVTACVDNRYRVGKWDITYISSPLTIKVGDGVFFASLIVRVSACLPIELESFGTNNCNLSYYFLHLALVQAPDRPTAYHGFDSPRPVNVSIRVLRMYTDRCESQSRKQQEPFNYESEREGHLAALINGASAFLKGADSALLRGISPE